MSKELKEEAPDLQDEDPGQELLAIIQTVRVIRPYLYNWPYLAIDNKEALKKLCKISADFAEKVREIASEESQTSPVADLIWGSAKKIAKKAEELEFYVDPKKILDKVQTQLEELARQTGQPEEVGEFTTLKSFTYLIFIERSQLREQIT